jgi:hypothetical protein
MAITGLRGATLQKFEVAPLNATSVGLHAAITLVVTYAKTAYSATFLGSALATDNNLRFTAGGGVAVGDILQDAASDELVKVTSITSAPTYAVQRGYRNTAREAHLAGATWNLVGQTYALSLLASSLLGCPQPVSIKGTKAGGSLTGDVKVFGTNINGLAINDTIALSDDAVVPSVKAFKTATSVDVPCAVTAADTVSLGVSKALGLPVKVASLARMLIHEFDGSEDAGAVTYDAADISKCLYTPAGTPNGAKLVALYFVSV